MLAKYSALESLRDGRTIEIRALKQDDQAGLMAAVSRSITWTVVRYADQISPGDTVYIWQSKGQDAAQAGNLAAGTMQSGMGWTRRVG